MRHFRRDKGAVAVEFALVLLPLILILMAIIDFGQIYTQQLTLTSAAREGARVMAVQNNSGLAIAAVTNAAGAAGMTAPDLVVPPPQACPTVQNPTVQPVLPPNVTVTVTYPLRSMTGWFDYLFPKGRLLNGVSVMRCGG